MLGIVRHEIVSKKMKELQQARIKGDILDTLIFVEHPEVVTIGPRANKDGVEIPIDYAQLPIDRGGGITWHGPGQVVAYPIFKWDLEGEENVANIIELIEDWIISSLRPLGITATRDEAMQGVWVTNQKIASIGLNFLKWTSRHGFTINYDTPIGRVEGLGGCGLGAGTTTSLSRVSEQQLTRPLLESMILAAAEKSVARSVRNISKTSW